MTSSKRAALADIPSAITFECLLLLAVMDYLDHLGDFGTCITESSSSFITGQLGIQLSLTKVGML